MLTQKTRLFFIGITSSLVVLALLGQLLFHDASIIFVSASALLIITVQFQIYRKISFVAQQQQKDNRQLQALMSVLASVSPRVPLPLMGDYTILPDFAALIIETINEHNPQNVVECGSGTSTLLVSYSLENNGSGHIVSLDQDANYASITRQQLAKHGLSDYADVRFADLSTVKIGQQEYRWYGVDSLNDLEQIDMLIIDGPTGGVRYPALPILIDRLSPNAVILIDDADRPGEQTMIERWKREYPDFSYRYIGVERGAVIMVRKNASHTLTGQGA